MRRLLVLLVLLLVLAGACTGSDPDLGPPGPIGTDGGSAADAGGDAGPPTFCATKPGAAWCEDFDTILDVASLLPESSPDMPKARLTQASFTSAPRSLLFELAGEKPSPQFTVLKHAVTTEKEMRLEVDWRWFAEEPSIDQTLQSITLKQDVAQVQFGRICGTLDGGATACGYFIATCVADRTPPCRSFDIPPPAALTRWSRVALQVRFANAGHVTYEEDGKVLVDVDDDTRVTPSTEPTSATIGLAVLAGNTSYHEVLFDNVVIELR